MTRSLDRRFAVLAARKSARVRAQSRIAEPLNPIDFVTGRQFLNVKIFPRQATVLKLLLLATELLTPYDMDVIAGWAAGFSVCDTAEGRRWSGMWGIVPDVVARANLCKAEGRWFFPEVTLVLGRRASKSLLSAVMVTWQLWRLLMLDDPQAHFGMPPGKKICIRTFSTTKEAAKRDLFGDVIALVAYSRCFTKFIDKKTATSITFYTPAQLRRREPEKGRRGLLEINATPTVSSATRGPAVTMLVMDEAAHLDGAGATSTAAQIRSAALPSMAQFSKESCLVMPSTPWSMTGAFYQSFVHATALDSNDESVNPYRFALQLPSWDMYLDHTRATELPMWPDGPCFGETAAPFLADDDALAKTREEDPLVFKVEYGAQFVSGVGAYFTQDTIERMFAPYRGQYLVHRERRAGQHDYIIHCDPSTSGANFATVVAHGEKVGGRVHCVIDLIHVFKPNEFAHGAVDYQVVKPFLLRLVEGFQPSRLTFDNHNVSFFTDFLAPAIRDLHLHQHVTVEKVSTTQSQKFTRFERLKSLANLDEIHLPPHPLTMEEARFLQVDQYRIHHPDNGSCKTDDAIDAVSWAVQHLSERDSAAIQELSELRLVAGWRSERHPLQDLFEGSRRTPDTGRRNDAYWRDRARRQGH